MRIHWRAAALLVALPLLFATCAGRRTADERRKDEQRERPGVEDSGSADAQKEPLRPTEAPRYTVVASIGTCAPRADGVRNVGACCNDKPCQGQCVVEPGSKDVQCSCFGIRGGCPQGQVCCKRTRGCAKLEDCDWIP